MRHWSDTFRLMGNLIGTDATGSFALATPRAAVFVRARSTRASAGRASRTATSFRQRARRPMDHRRDDRPPRDQQLIGTNAAGTAAVPNLEYGINARGWRRAGDPPTTSFPPISPAGCDCCRSRPLDPKPTASARRRRVDAARNHGRIQVSGNALGLGSATPGSRAAANIISPMRVPGVQIAATSASLWRTTSSAPTVSAGDGQRVPGVESTRANAFVPSVTPAQATRSRSKAADGVAVLPGNKPGYDQRQSIHSNGELGIDLNNDRRHGQRLLDMDDGANGLQNYPTITGADDHQLTFTASVSGSLRSAPFRRYRVDFYASAAADPSGFGEGERISLGWSHKSPRLGVVRVRFGFLSFPGSQITATATLMVRSAAARSGRSRRPSSAARSPATVIPVADVPFRVPVGSASATWWTSRTQMTPTLEDLIATAIARASVARDTTLLSFKSVPCPGGARTCHPRERSVRAVDRRHYMNR